jgi:hypothetical protein
MLASSPTLWYSSATFWTGAAAIVALLTLLMSGILWYLGSPRRLLIYGLTSETALLSGNARTRAGVGKELQVTLAGQILTDPHVVSVAIANRSRRDIRNADFEEGRPLRLNVGTPIVKFLDSYTGGPAMPEIKLDTENTMITIVPCLINRRQVITLDLLTDGPVSLSCENPPLADVTIRDGSKDDVEPLWMARVFPIIWLLILGGVVLYAIPTTRHGPLPGALILAGFSASFVSIIIALTIGAIREGGLSVRRPWTRSYYLLYGQSDRMVSTPPPKSSKANLASNDADMSSPDT